MVAVGGEEKATVGRLVDEHCHSTIVHKHLVRGGKRIDNSVLLESVTRRRRVMGGFVV